jgi:hypothetical protein
MRQTSASRSVHRILVVANETVSSDGLHVAIHEAVDDLGSARVAAVAPAHAVRRLQACVERLTRAGIPSEGYIGDAEPLRAIDDTLAFFPAGRLIVATYPEGRSRWLARDLVRQAEERFGLPVTHVVVDDVPRPLAA